eukprot:g3463.t1
MEDKAADNNGVPAFDIIAADAQDLTTYSHFVAADLKPGHLVAVVINDEWCYGHLVKKTKVSKKAPAARGKKGSKSKKAARKKVPAPKMISTWTIRLADPPQGVERLWTGDFSFDKSNEGVNKKFVALITKAAAAAIRRGTRAASSSA